jgi:hypothetical protein
MPAPMVPRSRSCRSALPTTSPTRSGLTVPSTISSLVGNMPELGPITPLAPASPGGFGGSSKGLASGLSNRRSELPRRLRVKRARELIGKIVIDAPQENLEISIECETIAGRFAVVEITAIPLVGPRLPLAPVADPADRSLDVCFVGDTASERQGFARWLEDPDSADAVPASLRRAQRVMVAGQFRRIRLDSKIWEGEPDPRTAHSWPVIGIATEPQPLHFLVSG